MSSIIISKLAAIAAATLFTKVIIGTAHIRPFTENPVEITPYVSLLSIIWTNSIGIMLRSNSIDVREE